MPTKQELECEVTKLTSSVVELRSKLETSERHRKFAEDRLEKSSSEIKIAKELVDVWVTTMHSPERVQQGGEGGWYTTIEPNTPEYRFLAELALRLGRVAESR